MSSTEWDKPDEDVEEVGPNEPDAVPPGSADEEGNGDGGGDAAAGAGWTEGGGELPAEGAGGIDAGTEPPQREQGTI